MLHAFRLADRRLTRTSGAEPRRQDRDEREATGHFRGGLALDPDRKVLYSLDVDAGTIAALDLDQSEGAEIRAGRHAAL